MIDPTAADVGRAVIYTAPYPEAKDEPGVITSFNHNFVFVRFKPEGGGIACPREHLRWE